MDLSTMASLFGLLGTGLSAVKTSVEISEAAKDLLTRDSPDLLEVKKLVADLYDRLLEAQKSQMAVQNMLLDLQKQDEKRQRFAAQKDRYRMTRTDMGGLVYSLIADKANGEPAHDLCANCFEDEVKSVLQPATDAFNTLCCQRCGLRVNRDLGNGRARTARIETGWDVTKPYGD